MKTATIPQLHPLSWSTYNAMSRAYSVKNETIRLSRKQQRAKYATAETQGHGSIKNQVKEEG